MKIELNRIDNDYNFEAHGSSPVSVMIDGSEKIGGHNAGARPMELLLMGLGGCSAIDIISILKKQKQKIANYKIKIDAQRFEGQIPSIFKKIEVLYILSGEIEKSKLERAIKLSIEKYCSVSKILKSTTAIEYFYILNDSPKSKLEEL